MSASDSLSESIIEDNRRALRGRLHEISTVFVVASVLMDTTTLVIIVLLVLLLGGGGFFYRGRRR